MSDHIKYMWVGGQRHCGRQEQQGREDQGCRWHKDVSLCLEFSSTRTWYAMAMVVDRRIVYTFNMSDHIKYMWVGDGRHCGRQGQQGGENQGGRWHWDVYHFGWNFLQLGYDIPWSWWLRWKLYILSTCLNTLSIYSWWSTTLWMARTIIWRRPIPWRLVISWFISTVRMFIDEDRGVISLADGGCI